MKQIYLKDVLKTYKSKEAGIKATEKYRNKFPIKLNEDVAGIVSDLMADGHLQGDPKWRLDYTSKSRTELKRFENQVLAVFGVKGKVRRCEGNKLYETYNYGVNNAVFSRMLAVAGVPIGSKVSNKFSIPKWILKDKKNFRIFIRRIMDCEGCVDVNSKCLQLSMYKAEDKLDNLVNFFQDIRNGLLMYYKIETTNPFSGRTFNTRKDGIITRPVKIKIKKKESLIRFNAFINFDSKEKRRKLSKIIDIWERSSKLRNKKS